MDPDRAELMNTHETTTLMRVVAIYEGSDGDATKGLYATLETLGPRGVVALNLFRAQKNSERAKGYRRRGYRGAAYDRKQWAMDNLTQALTAAAIYGDGLRWGWAEDPDQAFHKWVLYVDLPTGQVSFHTAERGEGPDYPDKWDQPEQYGARRKSRHQVRLPIKAVIRRTSGTRAG